MPGALPRLGVSATAAALSALGLLVLSTVSARVHPGKQKLPRRFCKEKTMGFGLLVTGELLEQKKKREQ